MQKPYFTTPEPDPENECLDCVYMELALSPVQPKGLLDKIFQLKAKVSGTECLNLHLNVKFNEHWEPLLGGRVKFGIKGGKLKLKLENAKLALASSQLDGSFELYVNQGIQHQESSIEAAWAESEADGVSVNLNTQKTEVSTKKFPFTSRHVTSIGAEEYQAWVFEVESEPVLLGLLKNAKLGTLNAIAKPWRVEATFEVSIEDVRLTAAEGLWSANISREQKIILDRGLAKLLIKHKLQPYVSRVELRYV